MVLTVEAVMGCADGSVLWHDQLGDPGRFDMRTRIGSLIASTLALIAIAASSPAAAVLFHHNGSLTVHVADASGAPVPDALVQVYTFNDDTGGTYMVPTGVVKTNSADVVTLQRVAPAANEKVYVRPYGDTHPTVAWYGGYGTSLVDTGKCCAIWW